MVTRRLRPMGYGFPHHSEGASREPNRPDMRPEAVVVGNTGLRASWDMVISGVDNPAGDGPRDLSWGGDVHMARDVVSVFPRDTARARDSAKDGESTGPV